MRTFCLTRFPRSLRAVNPRACHLRFAHCFSNCGKRILCYGGRLQVGRVRTRCFGRQRRSSRFVAAGFRSRTIPRNGVPTDCFCSDRITPWTTPISVACRLPRTNSNHCNPVSFCSHGISRRIALRHDGDREHHWNGAHVRPLRGLRRSAPRARMLMQGLQTLKIY